MPMTHFICPDGEEVSIPSCLSSCRMGQRCLTLPTLRKIAESERPYKGKPSITMLMNGTMLEFLKIKVPYAVRPESRAYALLGTDHHNLLASFADPKGEIAETTQQASDLIGTPDIVEPDEIIPGKYVLTDYKTYGSYRVQKMLGLQSRKEKHPTEVYKTNTKWGRRGEPKTITTWYSDPSKADSFDEEIQLNGYRLLLEESGYPISRIQIQVTVRDGGLQVARERGINKTIYLIPIRVMEDADVLQYFHSQKARLEQAIQNNGWSTPCNDRENWDGIRCRSYCDVALYCTKGIQMKKQAAGGA